jgi:hypothetical protein
LNFGARSNFAANIRNPYSFVLVPGGSISSHSSLKSRWGADQHMHQIRVDGMGEQPPAGDSRRPGSAVCESLEEMTVHTSNFAARYGQVAGASST